MSNLRSIRTCIPNFLIENILLYLNPIEIGRCLALSTSINSLLKEHVYAETFISEDDEDYTIEIFKGEIQNKSNLQSIKFIVDLDENRMASLKVMLRVYKDNNPYCITPLFIKDDDSYQVEFSRYKYRKVFDLIRNENFESNIELKVENLRGNQLYLGKVNLVFKYFKY